MKKHGRFERVKPKTSKKKIGLIVAAVVLALILAVVIGVVSVYYSVINGINKVQVPDVTGMSVLEANKLLRSYGLQMQIEGSGIAVSQSPAPEQEVLPTTVVRVSFEAP